MPPELVETVQPEYPEDARKADIEGKVVLEAIINADGDVENVRVLRKIPDAPSLEEAAIRAVQKWHYRPATRSGQPVKVFFTVVIDFSLPPPHIPDLDVLEARSQSVALDFKKEPLPDLFRVLERVSGLTIELRGDFPSDFTATLDWKEVTLQDALQRLAKQFDLKYQVADARRLTVIREERKAGAVEAR